jgi:hypothetical protein
MFTLEPLMLCLTILATLITGLPTEDHAKRHIPYKRQQIQNVTMTTLFIGTTSIVGEISTINLLNETTTVIIADNKTFDMTVETATGGKSIPSILRTGLPNILPTGAMLKGFFNEPTTTASRAKKSFVTIPSIMQG